MKNMSKNKKLEFYLTLNRNKNLRIRKQPWKLDDGELRVKLVMNVPVSFFTPPQIEAIAEITIPEQDLPTPEVSVTN